MARTTRQRRILREASRRRRRRNNIRFALVLAAVILVAIVVLIIALNGCDDEPSAPVDPATVTTTSTDPTATTVATASTTTAAAATTTSTEDVSPTAPTTASPTTPTTAAPKPPVEGHYVQPAGAAWNLLLVNDWNEMSQAYVAQIPLASFNATWDFDSRALPYLNAMIAAANQAGCGLWGQSLYRPYEMQEKLYWAEVNNWLYWGYSQAEAEANAATVVKRPGQSEHNTGLALDFECSEYPYLEEGFKDTKAYAWLMEHCAEYGFILRFPKNKEDITGVIYEPWHYRYVGVEAATEIMARGLCLEEYLEEKGL